MPSRREDVITEIMMAAEATGAPTVRDADVPLSVGDLGQIVVRTGAIVQQEECLGGPSATKYFLTASAPIEVYARTQERRDALLSALAATIGGTYTTATYRTMSLDETDVLSEQGTDVIYFASLSVTAEFEAPTPVG